MAAIRCARSLSQMKTMINHASKATYISVLSYKHGKDISYSQLRSTTSFTYTGSRSKLKYLRELYRRRLEVGPEPERHPSVYGCWSHDSEIYAFAQRYGEDFDENLLKLAFTQKSFVEKEIEKQIDLGIDMGIEMQDNTELADKGKTLASGCIKAYLRISYPQMFEEGICAIHNYLMSDETLHLIGSNMGLRELIQTADYPPADEDYITTFLAVIGALLESQGVKKAENFVTDFIIPQLIGKDINEIWHLVNPVGLLEALLKSQSRGPPEPRLIWKSAENTIMAMYHVGIYSDKQLIGKSPGETIVIAEEMAAREALKNILNITDSRRPLVMGKKAHNLELDYNKKNQQMAEMMLS